MSAQIIIAAHEPQTYGERVAAEVRGLAAKRQITGGRLAAAVGMTPMSMSRRLTGKQPFTVDELADVAAALGVSVAQLLPHRDSNTEPAGNPVGALRESTSTEDITGDADVIEVDFVRRQKRYSIATPLAV